MSIPKFVTLGCRLNTYETEAMRELVNDENLKNVAVNDGQNHPLDKKK